MRSEWPIVRLGDCCLKMGSGATPRGGQKSYLDDGPVALIRSQNVYNAGFQPEGLAYISDEQAAKLDNVVVEPGDVLVNITGDSVARVCSAPREVLPARVNQHVAIVRPRPDLFDTRYLRYFFVSPHQQALLLSMAGGGGTRKALTKGMLENLRIPMPPLRIQRNIVEPLELIDRAIAVYRSKNATLESIIQAIFKSWFIDFDPVHAKAAGQEPEGMDAETAALFPSVFEDSEMGPIPRGWRCMPLDDAIELNPRRDLARGTVAPYLDMANTPLGGHRPETVVERAMGSGVRFTNGDTLLARITPSLENGKTAFVDFLDDGQVGWGSTEFIVMKPKQPLPSFFGYLLAREPAFRAFAVQTMTGSSGRQRVDLGGLSEYRLAIPDARIATAFGEFVEPLRARIAGSSEQAQILADLRDTLLPRLIWGRLRIPEAEQIVEEAVS